MLHAPSYTTTIHTPSETNIQQNTCQHFKNTLVSHYDKYLRLLQLEVSDIQQPLNSSNFIYGQPQTPQHPHKNNMSSKLRKGKLEDRTLVFIPCSLRRTIFMAPSFRPPLQTSHKHFNTA